MPAVIPAVFGAVAVEVVGGGIFGYIAGAVVAGTLSRAMAPRATFPDTGVLDNSSSAVEPIPVIYGSRRSGCTRAFITVTDGAIFSKEFLHVVCAICEGEISAINTIYLDDVASTDARFSGLITIEKYTGTDTQAASAALIAATESGNPSTGPWSTAHQGKGVAYAYIKVKWNKDAFHGFPVFTFDVDGKKVWDPRVAGSPSYIAFSNNPALCILDYLMNTRYGWKIPESRINLQSFRDAANYCDQMVQIPDSASPSFRTQKRYTCDGIVLPDNGRKENMDALLTSCRGSLALVGGQYKLILDRAHWALSFGSGSPASSDVVQIPSMSPSLPITIEFWATPDNALPVGMFDSAPLEPNVLRNFDNGQVEWWSASPIISLGLSAGERVHLTFIFRHDGTNRIIDWYKNGVAQTSGFAIAPATFAWTTLRWGNINNGANGWYAGQLDGCRVYSGRSLTSVEVNEHYNGIFRDETGLVGRWEFNEGSGSTAYDWSGNGNDGAFIGRPTYTAQLPGNPFEFTEDNIIGGWSFRKGGKRDRLNRVRARYFDPDKNWQPEFAVWDDAATRAASDDDLLLESEIALPFTSDYYTALQLAMLEQKISREDLIAEFTSTIEGLRCEVGDVVVVTHSTPGWDEKPFRVVALEPQSSDEVRVSLKEYQASSYDLDDIDLAPVIPDTTLPNLFVVTAPSGLTFAQSTSVWDTAVLSWTGNDAFAAEYQVEYKLATDSAYTIIPRTGDTSTAIPRLLPRLYDFRVKAINKLGVSSSYATIQERIIGPSSLPFGSLSGSGAVRKLSTITVGSNPQEICYCPSDNLVYVACRDANRVDIINPDNDTNIGSISITGVPTVIVYSPPNNRLYVATSELLGSPSGDVIFVVNPETRQVEYSITVPYAIVSACFCPKNGRLYFNGPLVFVIDPLGSPTGDIVSTISPPLFRSNGVGEIAYCPSNQKIYAVKSIAVIFSECVQVIDPTTDTEVTTISLGGTPYGICYCPENDRLYVCNFEFSGVHVINPHTNAVVSTIASPSPPEVLNPVRIVFAPDTALLYQSNYALQTLNLIRPSDNLVLDSPDLNIVFPDRICWIPQYGKLYVGHSSGGSPDVGDKISVVAI